MKPWIALCFLAGLLAGWAWRAHPAAAGSSNATNGKNAVRQESSAASAESWVARGKVEIDPGHLARMLATGESPALSADDILSSDHRALDLLAEWTGLDAGEKADLSGILRDAAARRCAWEKANVTVEGKGDGFWALHFPADAGMARQSLRHRIEDRFGARTAAAIALAGDIDHFFGFAALQPEFKDGTIEIHARRVDRNSAPDPAGSRLRFQIYVRPGRPWVEIMTSPEAPQQMALGRLIGLLGDPQAVADSVTRATAREHNPFACAE